MVQTLPAPEQKHDSHLRKIPQPGLRRSRRRPRIQNDRAWRTALEHDAYPWLNLLEMDDSTKLWEQYGLGSAAGQTYLIDRDGTILAINPMADELERLLREKL